MAESMSIQQRIAALNLNQVGQPNKPQSLSNKPAPPALPRSRSTDNEVTRPEEDGNPTSPIGNMPAKGMSQAQMPPPALPTRPELRRPPSQSQTPKSAPSLPPRQASGVTIARKDSNESISSTISTGSSISGPSTRTSNTSASRRTSIEPSFRIVAPTYDPTTLPPLPPKKPSAPKRPTLATARSASNTLATLKSDPTSSVTSSIPTSPPSLPVRTVSASVKSPIAAPERRQSTPASSTEPSRKSVLSMGFNSGREVAPSIPQRPNKSPVVVANASDPTPPPVPLSSRPDIAQLQASKPQPPVVTSNACLKCRDFSEADGHAARFPRESIPSTDVGWLSHQLTEPFPSATDKARTIFTWLHHNIAYDAKAFFGGNVQASTPAGTISSGLAVCEGYAGLFTALATHAGLESIVIGGHGKGFGHKAMEPGEAVPSFNSNHAWNVVKIDGGEWKLVETCWGAGYLDGNGQYNKHFSPEWFVTSNEEFGRRHFPKDRNMFYRSDGRTISWEEYMIGEDGPGEDVTVCSGVVEKHGLSQSSFLPKKKHIRLRGAAPTQRIQFQFEKLCRHWDGEKLGKGKPHVFLLNTGGKDGRKRDMIPFSTNGQHWWCDIALQDLGCVGQTINVFAVTQMNGKDARGLTPEEVGRWIGRRSMAFEGVASWQLV